MNKKIKFAIAMIAIVPTLNLLYIASSDTGELKNVKQAITLSDGFTVPEDAQTVTESGIDSSYVQSNTQEVAFQAGNLEGISSKVASEIIQVEPQADGTSLVLMREYNTADASQLGTQLYERSTLLHVDTDGVVLKSYNLGAAFAANKMGAVGSSFTNSEYDITTQYASKARLLNTPTGYIVYYVSSNESGTKVGYTFKLDSSLNFENIEPRVNFTGVFIENPKAFFEYNTTTGTYEMSNLALFETVENDELSMDYQMFNIDMGMTSTLNKTLELPSWTDITGYSYAGGSKALKSDLYVLPDGSFTGVVKAIQGNAEYNGFVIWNEDGTINKKYFPGYEGDIKILPHISNTDFIFFQENENGLKKLNLQTGYMTLVKAYPTSTNLGIQPYNDSAFGSSYLFYGYVKSFRGMFTGFGTNPGAIIGLMDGSFNIITANVTPTDFPVTLDLKGNGSSIMVAYGNLNENRGFANEPTPVTNSIGGNGWIDKTSGLSTLNKNDVYIGRVSLVDDYAPAIKVGFASQINKDAIGSYDDLTSELLKGVEVYDSFDLDPNNQLNLNLTQSEINLNLFNRINKSPYNLNSNIEWETLGLDSSQIGFNVVKYFITDSNNHITANSKVVNVIDNNTNIDSSNTLALSAGNVMISLEQAKALSTNQALSLSAAKSWNLNDGTNLTNQITVNSTQLSAINNNSTQTVLPLDLTVLQGGKQVTRQIKVFIGGTYDPQTDVILFCSNFDMALTDAKSLNKDIVIEKGKISAYNKTSGTKLNNDQIEIDLQIIKTAVDVGHYNVGVSALGAKSFALVNLYDSTTILSNIDAIDAHNVIYTSQEILGMTQEQLETSIIEKSYAKVWELSSGSRVNFSVDTTDVLKQVGVYNVTFTSDNSTNKSIKVFVFENPTCDGQNCDAKLTSRVIDAVNFDLEVAQVYSLTPLMVMQLAHANAYNVDDNTMLKLDVNYSKIEPASGSYDVKFTTCFDIEKTVRATVGDDVVISPKPPKPPQIDSNVDEEEEVEEVQEEVTKPVNESLAISGKDAFFTLEEIDELQSREKLNDEILKRSETRAWIVESNQTLSPILVDSNAVEYNSNHEEPIEMEVNYTPEESIEILEQKYGDDLELYTDDKEAIAAIDFGLTVSEVAHLSPAEVKSLANSVAWNLEDMSNIEITSVDYSEIKSNQGVYPVKFTTESGTTLSVNAYVGQNNRPTFLDEGYVIFANDFELGVISDGYETGANPIDLANSVVINQQTLAEEPASYFHGNYEVNKPGVGTATIGLDQERSTTIEVTVIENIRNSHTFSRKIILTLLGTFAALVVTVYYIKSEKRLI